MSYTIRYRPQLDARLDEEGNLQYNIDWSDCCEGGYDEDGDGIGYPDECDDVWQMLMELFRRHPAMLGYPTASIEGRVVLVDNPGADPFAAIDPWAAVAQPRVRAVPTMPTCRFYSPAQARIETEGAVPLEKWPFGKHFPYGVCTNPAVVGHGGFGPCRVDHPSRMPSCNAYVAQPLVRRGEIVIGPMRYVLESGRAGQGLVHWKFQTINETKPADAEDRTVTQYWTGVESETQAREAWSQATAHSPIDNPVEQQTKPFIKSLVGACHGSAA